MCQIKKQDISTHCNIDINVNIKKIRFLVRALIVDTSSIFLIRDFYTKQ